MAVQTITNPKEQTVNVVVAPGQTIAFDFDLDSATFERSGNDLTISLDDGGQIVLGSFFVASDISSLPPLQLADGTQVNSGDFLSAFDVDVTPAADGAPGGGGINAYDDGAGSLVDGLGLSDSLGTFYWNSATARTEDFEGEAAPLGGGAVGLPGPVPQTGEYFNARAVLYEPNPGNFNPSVNPLGLNINVPGPLNIIDGGQGYLDLSGASSNPDGSLRLDLTQDALDAMADSNGGKVYDYITVEGSDGVTYVIQVVLNNGSQFNSAWEDSQGQPDPDFKGEWHTQQDSYTYNIDTSSSNRTSPGDAFWLRGMTATGAGQHNRVLTNSGDDVVKVERGMLASVDGSNTINTGKDAGDEIHIGSTLVAVNGGKNSLTSETINVSASTQDGTVLSKGGLNDLDASGDVTISSTPASGRYGTGINAIYQTQGGKNVINSDNGTVKVEVTVDEADGMGLSAGKDSSNKVTAGDEVNVNVNVTDASRMLAYGLEGYKGGKNSLAAKNGANITVTAEEADEAAGLFTDNGANLVEVTDGDLNLSVTNDSSGAYGLKAGDSNDGRGGGYDARNELKASGDVKLTLRGEDGFLEGMHSHNTALSGQHGNFINAGGDVIIDANDPDAMSAFGMQALDNGYNEINSITGKALIEAHGTQMATGLHAGDRNLAGGTASNLINAAEVELKVSADDMLATGMQASTGGSNSIEASLSAKVEAMGAWAHGLSADADNARNSVNVVGQTGNVSASVTAMGNSDSKQVAGLFALPGENSVHAKFGDIELVAGNVSGSAIGMQAGGSSVMNPNYLAKNVLIADEGNINLDVTGVFTASGMLAQNTASGGQHGNFIEAGGDVTINAGSTSTELAYGMHAIDNGYNSITAESEVSLKVTGESAVGMQAREQSIVSADSINIIKAPTVSIDARATDYDAYAMYATEGGTNEIHGVSVTLEASAINGDAFAMYAVGNGLNLIQLTESGRVELHGDVFSDGNGRNEINGSTGYDEFIINGAIEGGADAIFIDGQGGGDKLVLMASDMAEFTARYGDWLSNPVNVSGIDSVEVRYSDSNVDLDEFTAFQSMLEGAFPSGTDIIYSLGDGDSVLQAGSSFDFTGDFHLSGGLGEDSLDLGNVTGNFTLDQMANMIDGFEHIDLGAGGSNAVNLTIDSLLDGLNIDGKLTSTPYEDGTALRISGEVGSDQVSLGASGWSHDGNTCVYDSITYDVYTNSQDASQYLLIQQGLVL